ncbi:outer membrane beta-barrel protein [Halomonas sp. SpR8]|uniref:outer membrane beta-barrel protein n=1 Tax=Halomonas sp. SpR8 TaxID=3050463 RepID=UPI0027E5B3F2|nr:outer membrane beta-barrel protein [Halomonas sp. SpR8]MDQ7727322.1 outer membrane beta-barrel protein [Halomonas sp. SpR8]
MKLQLLTGIAISSLLAASAAAAQTAQSAGTGYVGIQAAQVDIDIDAPGSPIYVDSNTLVNIDSISSLKPTAAIAKLGYNVIDFIAIEGRVGAGLTSDSGSISGSISQGQNSVAGDLEVDADLDTLAGLYAVGHVPLGETNVSLYGVLGYTYIEASVEILGYSATERESGASYGAGIQAQFTPTVSANLEYMSYLDESDYDITAVGVGVNYHYQY